MSYEYIVLFVVQSEIAAIGYPDGKYETVEDDSVISEVQMVNDLGEQGWEMVAASYYYDDYPVGRIWLKREY